MVFRTSSEFLRSYTPKLIFPGCKPKPVFKLPLMLIPHVPIIITRQTKFFMFRPWPMPQGRKIINIGFLAVSYLFVSRMSYFTKVPAVNPSTNLTPASPGTPLPPCKNNVEFFRTPTQCRTKTKIGLLRQSLVNIVLRRGCGEERTAKRKLSLLMGG